VVAEVAGVQGQDEGAVVWAQPWAWGEE